MMRELLFGVAVFCLVAIQVEARDLRVGAFNIQVFGVTKASKPEVMDVLAKIVRRYDILLIQEIRDIKELAIYDLLDLTNQDQPTELQFSMLLSERLGRTSSKEQYAYFYRSGQGLTVTGAYVYDDGDEALNTDTEIYDIFEREPYVVAFDSTNTVLSAFTLAGIHAKPDDAPDEINALRDVIFDAKAKLGNSDVMVLGDMNADCSYVTSSEWPGINLRTDDAYTWWIGEEADTTVKTTDCAYDRFVSHGSGWASGMVTGSAAVYEFNNDPALGTISVELAEDVSDHFPIEFLLKEKLFVKYTVSDVYVVLENPDVSLSQDIFYNMNESFHVTDGNNNVVAVLRTVTDSEVALKNALGDIFTTMMTSSRYVKITVLPIKNRYAGRQKCDLFIEVQAMPSSQSDVETNLNNNGVAYQIS